MKKILCSILMLSFFLFVSCNNKIDITNAQERLLSYVSNLDEYEASCTMELKRNNNTAVFNVDVSYLKPDYFKVCFKSQNNQNEQIIIKNDSGVYVLTPTLNKQFQFDSDWPLNSSHAYLINSIAKDITNDPDATIIEEDDEVFVITANISHKTNQNLDHMKFYFDAETLKPIKTVYFDNKDQIAIKVTFSGFNTEPGLTKDSFDVNKVMDQETAAIGEGVTQAVSGTLAVALEISGTNLNSQIIKSDYTILCYTGDKPYTIISQTVEPAKALTPVRIYSSFELIDKGICAISANSLTFYYQNQEIVIISNSLTSQELIEIANAITYS